jgi:D-sedoheptulose 7-phosphate isomerase
MCVGPRAPTTTHEAREFGPISAYLDELRAVLAMLDGAVVSQVISLLLRAYHDGTTVFVMGNGGSATTASHFACDLGKGLVTGDGRRFKVVALTDNVAMLTAWANDTHYERVFVEQLDNLLRPRDLVVGISASGNSPNVLRAMELARRRGATTIGLTGFRGGHLKALCDVCVVVPSAKMDQIEDTHLALQHLVCRVLRELLSVAPPGPGEDDLSKNGLSAMAPS